MHTLYCVIQSLAEWKLWPPSGSFGLIYDDVVVLMEIRSEHAHEWHEKETSITLLVTLFK